MSILKIKDSQGNWVGVPTVKGDTGNGISSAVLNDDYTLTLTFTDGTTYKTPSIRGEKGEKGDKGDKGDTGEVTTEEFLKAFPTDVASGAVASFSDGADNLPLKSLVVDINPVQDLHGQESPYPAGGGKNKITATEYNGGLYNKQVGTSLKTTDESRVRYVQTNNVITISNDTTYFLNCLFATSLLPVGTYTVHFETSESNNRSSIYTTTDDLTVLSIVENELGAKTVSKTITLEESARIAVALGTNGGEATITNLQVESGSAYTAWSPYENICPISGWTGMTVNASGKNLFDEANATIYKRYFQNTSGGYVWTSSPDSSSYVFKCLPNTIYTLKPNNPNVNIFRVATINVSIEESENVTLNQVSVMTNPRTIKTDSDATYIVIQQSSAFARAKETQLQIELGDSATEYEPYNGTTLPISWQTEAGTVYGGSLDVLSGVLTVDCGKTENPNYTVSTFSDAQRIRIGMLGSKDYGKIICNVFKTLTNNAHTLYGIKAMTSNIAYAYVPLDLTAEEIAEIMSVCEIQYQYRPSYIQTYQLDGHTLNSLYGQNNIFADTGDTMAEYRADTKLYIEKLTQPQEDDMIADSAISEGQFFMIGNSLYRALANIASGATITVGTNAQRVSLSDALNLVNA